MSLIRRSMDYKRAMSECREIGKVLQTYLDSELGEARAGEVIDHLESCLKCGLKAETYMRIKQALILRGIEEQMHFSEENEEAIDRLREFAASLVSPK